MNGPREYISDTHIRSVDGLDKVMGKAKYVGDMFIPGMLFARQLVSSVPHARIIKVNIEPALKIKGVVAVITCEDFVDHGNFGWPVKDAYILAYQKVRYVGDPIAVVAGKSEQAAEEGVRAIELELEELPVISDAAKSLEVKNPLIPLKPIIGDSNLCAHHIVRNGDPDPILARCEYTVDQSYEFAHQEHAYIETEGVIAIPEPGFGVTIYANNQTPHINRDNTAEVLGMLKENVRIIQPPVGGSFGGKDDIVYQLTAQAAKLALLTKHPVRLVLNREESLKTSYKREAGNIRLRIGADAKGLLRAARGEYLVDSGAYASQTPLSSWRSTMHLLGAYRYDAAQVDTDAVYTNNGYSGACRGFGNLQAAAASEIAIDELASSIGIDPIEFRLNNCLRSGDKTFTGNILNHNVSLENCITWVREKSSWIQRRNQLGNSSSSSRTKRGIGVACYFHGTGLGGEGCDYARATIKIERDHTITIQSGLTDYGQGSRTVFTIITAEELAVSPERIHILRPDTHTALETGPTVASRATITGGNAFRNAAQKINQTLQIVAADLGSCEPSQIYHQVESFIGPDEIPIPFDQVVEHAFSMGLQLSAQGYWQLPAIHWDFDSGKGVPYFTYCYGAQIAEVEVNCANGEIKVTKVWAAHDGGKIIFPNGAKGQLLGGIAQGIGYALTEGFEFQDCFPKKLNFKEYTIPTALDVPEIEYKFIDTEFPEGPFGAKNLAEPVMIAITPAISNAVFHATGIRCRKFPISPAWLKRMMERSEN